MKHRFLRLLSLLMCLLLPLTACAQSAETETTEAPNVTEILREYTTLDLSEHLGKTVLINFFTQLLVDLVFSFFSYKCTS